MVSSCSSHASSRRVCSQILANCSLCKFSPFSCREYFFTSCAGRGCAPLKQAWRVAWEAQFQWCKFSLAALWSTYVFSLDNAGILSSLPFAYCVMLPLFHCEIGAVVLPLVLGCCVCKYLLGCCWFFLVTLGPRTTLNHLVWLELC